MKPKNRSGFPFEESLPFTRFNCDSRPVTCQKYLREGRIPHFRL